jgi:hypothetical protein
MSRSRSWLGKLGGLLAACLVIAMVAGPMIDSVTCQGDGDDKAAAVALVDQPATADAGPDTGKINTGDRPRPWPLRPRPLPPRRFVRA